MKLASDALDPASRFARPKKEEFPDYMEDMPSGNSYSPNLRCFYK